MNRLLDIGFEPAGHWTLVDSELRLELVKHMARSNVLYAFVCDGAVMYVGKTTKPLAFRMAQYRRGHRSQRTNAANHDLIRERLAAGQAIAILALPDNGLMRYGKFHLNLAAGLEDDLIRVLSPPWNGGRPEPAEPEPQPGGPIGLLEAEAEAEAEALMTPSYTFNITLQDTYFRRGFFNVSVNDQKHIGADGETIEFYLDGQELPVKGIIDRRAQSNGTPRLSGGKALRDWFQTKSGLMGTIEVGVMSPNSIRLRSVAN